MTKPAWQGGHQSKFWTVRVDALAVYDPEGSALDAESEGSAYPRARRTTRRDDAARPSRDDPYGDMSPWRLTAAISPRPYVRVAATDAAGRVLNSYTGRARTDGVEPAVPWAVHLAGEDRRFRLLCFDLDAKTPGATAQAEKDAATLTDLLRNVGLGVVVCQSGPSGGRHVWTGLTESVDADTVACLARLARGVCPSLDIAPLANPATGCVRPPGAPHRTGDRSTVLTGDIATLTNPSGTAAQVRLLTEALARLVNQAEPTHQPSPGTPIPVDEHGRLYLPGPKRDLPTASAAALGEDAACGDASAVLWRVLIGAAAAHWHHADIAAIAAHSPGLEHVRTYRDGSHRRPRTAADTAQVLRRQWDKAVRFTAATPRTAGADPTFDARADAIAATVRAIQTRADASAGRWSTGGGPADRRILDALCLLTLRAVTVTVEADIRRLALIAGIGRETARTALWRLAADGWITQTQSAEGVRAAHWTIRPPEVIHTGAEQGRSQADPRPVGAGPAERTLLITELTDRATAAAHDLFTYGKALGHLAGNVYARTTRQPQDLAVLTARTGRDPDRTAFILGVLVDAGILVASRDGWRRPARDRRTAAAKTFGVDGRLDTRTRLYALERDVWAWWQAEQAWRQAPRRAGSKRRPGWNQLVLVPADGTHHYGPHPTRPDGRLNWRLARHHAETRSAPDQHSDTAAQVA